MIKEFETSPKCYFTYLPPGNPHLPTFSVIFKVAICPPEALQNFKKLPNFRQHGDVSWLLCYVLNSQLSASVFPSLTCPYAHTPHTHTPAVKGFSPKCSQLHTVQLSVMRTSAASVGTGEPDHLSTSSEVMPFFSHCL